MSYGTWNGNLGGSVAAADAKCLVDLTTHPGWKGFADANARGILASSNVRAFLCGQASCNELAASRTYAFANAGNPVAGGATFTTDGSGRGPGDAADWSDATHFGAPDPYWSDRVYGSSTLWGTDAWSASASCNTTASWDTGASIKSGALGYPAQPGFGRWYSNNVKVTCDTPARLVCYVNP
jgi:hypothetical protein